MIRGVQQPLVVAHRGSSKDRAEHTLGAYALALDQGADGLECDVRLTADGHLVCVHDRRVDRTSTGRGVVSRLTLERMSQLDYGSWHDAAPERAGLLTLEELLGLVVDAGKGTKLFVETKHPARYAGLVEAKLIALLHRFGLATPPSKEDSPVVVMSFSARAVRRIRRDAPALPTELLLGALIPGRRDDSPPADNTGPGNDPPRADPEPAASSAEH